MYNIKNYSYNQAQLLGVIIRPSAKSNYKIDVFDKNNLYVTSIGNKNYSDYPTYRETHGEAYANKRRRLYHIRHAKDNTARGFFSNNILW